MLYHCMLSVFVHCTHAIYVCEASCMGSPVTIYYYISWHLMGNVMTIDFFCSFVPRCVNIAWGCFWMLFAVFDGNIGISAGMLDSTYTLLFRWSFDYMWCGNCLTKFWSKCHFAYSWWTTFCSHSTGKSTSFEQNFCSILCLLDFHC